MLGHNAGIPGPLAGRRALALFFMQFLARKAQAVWWALVQGSGTVRFCKTHPYMRLHCEILQQAFRSSSTEGNTVGMLGAGLPAQVCPLVFV